MNDQLKDNIHHGIADRALDDFDLTNQWDEWQRFPERARVWFIFGGPGQGKSTLGQFFCQIQRAAYIMSDDAPQYVSASTRTLANEIKAVASKAGHWPTVPRIPVFIELREFAHWFSKQPKDSPRGVLTYLAHRLFQDTEKNVKTGTLERALQAGSWFVVFDGLDEVPSDNKDLASKQVKYFIEEVVLRTNCDMLCVCTSRPQGYGGQFDNLDGSKLHLMHLEPTRAIECAKPVLSIGRSASDARNFLSILTSAVNSPGGVRELMRTPLQAHIMAVVVRDGGKPPERRWQLFNNFYEVIRKREANKELTDPKIERLLRQNDKLLRSIHNRMGFVLHAAAETSQGATTSMSRSDFNTLAKSTVQQMLDENIDEMVQTLCQATEHRLVLVNTPDDGQHLRFDVRQLQEFFAAEFIYESVSINQLQDRLRLIAGDAHWREVMHFLYSALVEEQRWPELDAAIRILEEINDGDPNTPTRLFARRMGTGASIAGRLLTEGVLEQDKRVRQHFRNALEPLFSHTAFNAANLSSTTQPNSRTWLCNVLVQQIEEADASESIGAAVLLAALLDDSDLKVPVVAQLISSKGTAYIDGVIDCFGSLDPIPDVSHWILRMTLDRVIDSGTESLSLKAVQNGLALISCASDNAFDAVAAEKRLSPTQRMLLRECCDAFPERRGQRSTTSRQPRFELAEIPYGHVVGRYSQNDWTTNANSREFIPHPELDLDSSRGLLRLVTAIAIFDHERTRSSFINVLVELTSTKEPLLSAISNLQRSRFPALDRSVPLNKLRGIVEKQTDQEFAESLQSQMFGPFRLERWVIEFSILRSGVQEAGFIDLIRIRPAVAVLVWFGGVRRHLEIPANIRETAIIENFKTQARRTPSVFVDFAEILGAIIGDGAEQDLRSELVKEASKFPLRVGPNYTLELFPFKISLPLERALLPPLLAAIVRHQRLAPRGHDGRSRHNIADQLKSYQFDRDLLHQIAGDMGTPTYQRAAAALFALLIDTQDTKILNQYESVLLECASNRNEVIVDSVLFVISLHGSQEDATCVTFLGRLFDALKHDYAMRRKVQGLLGNWREKSLAPIHRESVTARWIAGKE